MSTITIPEPTVSHDDRSRTLDYRINVDENGDGFIVRVSIHHDRERKRFDAFAYTVELREQGRAYVLSFGGGVRVVSEPVARFSAKALDYLMRDIIVGFPVDVVTTPALEALFDNAAAGRLDTPRGVRA